MGGDVGPYRGDIRIWGEYGVYVGRMEMKIKATIWGLRALI